MGKEEESNYKNDPNWLELKRSLDETREDFDRRNRLVISNTFRLAKACAEAEKKSGEFIISHPNLNSYHNCEYVNSKFPDGCSPVFFIDCLGELDQFEFTQRLWESSFIRKYCNLGQSFGFDRTRIWPDPNYPTIRIAGGTEDREDLEQLSLIFKGVLESL